MGERVAGICYIKIDGEQLVITGGVEVPAMPVNRETKMALDRVAGYKETAALPYVKATGAFTPGFPLAKLQNMTNGTVTVELPAKQVYTLGGAYVVGEMVVKADEGEIDIELNGLRGEWQ